MTADRLERDDEVGHDPDRDEPARDDLTRVGWTAELATAAGPVRAGLHRSPGWDGDTAVLLLHGRGDDPTAWQRVLPAIDERVSAKALPPLALVMPDAVFSHRAGFYVDSAHAGGSPVETALAVDLPERAAEHLGATPARWIVAGYSMGGAGAVRYLLAHPGRFAAAVALSPSVYVPEPPQDSSARRFGAFGRVRERFDPAIYAARNYPALLAARALDSSPSDAHAQRVFLAYGDEEHALADEPDHAVDLETARLADALRDAGGFELEQRTYAGGHDWRTWGPGLLDGLEWATF